ncbi:unnamed protein product [Microthlaspi erraticum]|uniref:Uncharacterized protein n=1 Tax=Microthlaspi erraticum TaxID=1685480 RepID=A0A6D2K4A9_9BRAS|nr:unnamed protein product [Microthlaspi erraticum]
MDFIKTSSLRALIELTFQRNWNGFIWMSRKGVIAKRVKTAPDGHIENQRPNRTVRLAEERCSALGQNCVRPTEVSAKVQTARPITHHDPGNLSPRSAKPQRHATTAHDQAREPGNASRPRNSSRTTADAPSEPGNYATSGRETIGQFIRPTSRPTNHPATTVPTRPKTRLSGRSSRPTVRTPRSTRSRF